MLSIGALLELADGQPVPRRDVPDLRIRHTAAGNAGDVAQLIAEGEPLDVERIPIPAKRHLRRNDGADGASCSSSLAQRKAARDKPELPPAVSVRLNESVPPRTAIAQTTRRGAPTGAPLLRRRADYRLRSPRSVPCPWPRPRRVCGTLLIGAFDLTAALGGVACAVSALIRASMTCGGTPLASIA